MATNSLDKSVETARKSAYATRVARTFLFAASILVSTLSLLASDARFTDELWAGIEPIYAKTLQHPFLTGLADGTLPRAKFEFYLQQDALYLDTFSEALKALAAKAPRR